MALITRQCGGMFVVYVTGVPQDKTPAPAFLPTMNDAREVARERAKKFHKPGILHGEALISYRGPNGTEVDLEKVCVQD